MNSAKRIIGLFFIAALGACLVWFLLVAPRASAATFTVTKTADTNDGVCDSDCSLREAIVAANAALGDDVITLPAGIYTLTLGQLNITSDLTLNGVLSSTTIITNSIAGNRVISIGNGITVTISEVTISGGNVMGCGGGIYNDMGVLMINYSTVSSNTASFCGGGIANYRGTVAISNSVISGNDALPGGGGISNGANTGPSYSPGTLIINTSIISDNAGVLGGGIWNADGVLTLNTSIVSGNSSFAPYSGVGAGIATVGPNGTTTTISNSVISGNASIGAVPGNRRDDGGGIYNAGSTTILINSTILNNKANSWGGGIYNRAAGSPGVGAMIISNSVFIGNDGPGGGGGIFNDTGGTMSVTNSTFVSNTSMVTAIWNVSATLAISNSVLMSNIGGGIFNSGVLTLTDTTISSNVLSNTTAYGSGLVNADSFVPKPGVVSSLNNVTIAYNSGYGILQGAGIVNLKNTLIAGNHYGDCSGTLTSQDYNLIQNTTGCTITGTTTHNFTGQNPNLGPLQNNGGPTLTHALLPGSLVIDEGNPAPPGSGGTACEATDQRGTARPWGAFCDIGAYEATPTVQFSNSAFSVKENAGNAGITATLGVPLTQTITVSYTTSNGMAVAGSDYLTTTGTLTFTPGVTTLTFTVPIINDVFIEGDETVILTLSNPMGALLGQPNPATLTIVDDDPVENKVYLPIVLR